MARKSDKREEGGAKPATRAKAREGKKAIVGYFSPSLSQSMHLVAAQEGTKIQALVGEALDMLLVNRGMHPHNER